MLESKANVNSISMLINSPDNDKCVSRGFKRSPYQVPDYPKVGFWTIRVSAQGQIEEKRVIIKFLLSNQHRPHHDYWNSHHNHQHQVKIEKYYVPMFEVFLRMPSFHFDTDRWSAFKNQHIWNSGLYVDQQYNLCHL